MGNEQKGRRPNRERPAKGATPREGERSERELEWHLESVVQYATD